MISCRAGLPHTNLNLLWWLAVASSSCPCSSSSCPCSPLESACIQTLSSSYFMWCQCTSFCLALASSTGTSIINRHLHRHQAHDSLMGVCQKSPEWLSDHEKQNPLVWLNEYCTIWPHFLTAWVEETRHWASPQGRPPQIKAWTSSRGSWWALLNIMPSLNHPHTLLLLLLSTHTFTLSSVWVVCMSINNVCIQTGYGPPVVSQLGHRCVFGWMCVYRFCTHFLSTQSHTHTLTHQIITVKHNKGYPQSTVRAPSASEELFFSNVLYVLFYRSWRRGSPLRPPWASCISTLPSCWTCPFRVTQSGHPEPATPPNSIDLCISE